jgi:predicted dehydrogenase
MSVQKLDRNQKIKWGILGTGKIARQFAEQLVKIKDAQLIGVASRHFENAQKFCEKFVGIKAYDSYEALCKEPEIDVIYVCTPTHMHLYHCNLVLDSNKALLCEKPFTRNYAEALAIIQKAQQKQLFCMEAMWMRFNPCIQIAKQAIDENKIGNIRSLHAELGYHKDPNRLDTALNGRGAGLTFGCYTVSLAIYFLGKPDTVSSHIIPNPQGGDETGALLFHYPDKVASLFYSEGATLSNKVSIYAQEGSLHIDDSFINAPAVDIVSLRDIQSRSIIQRLQIRITGIFNKLISIINQGNSINKYDNIGLSYEAEEVIKCLRLGLIESKIMPLNETLIIHHIIDPILFGNCDN